MVRLFLLVFSVAALVAIEVPTTVQRVIDGDTIETAAGRVRLLWIDTPESHDNAHGQAMPEGKSAAAELAGLLPEGTAVRLWSPRTDLERDRYGRLLALVMVGETTAQEAQIRAGWSPYWRKYGPAPEPWAGRLAEAQEAAEKGKVGAWATAPGYMRDKANETTAPKR